MVYVRLKFLFMFEVVRGPSIGFALLVSLRKDISKLFTSNGSKSHCIILYRFLGQVKISSNKYRYSLIIEGNLLDFSKDFSNKGKFKLFIILGTIESTNNKVRSTNLYDINQAIF